tara:strand:+ start:1041 stop:1793 length:753 start_codon:yes stop_codon:yes gene_type:complete
MADQFTAGETFTEDEQVTHQKLNLAQTNLKFTSAAVDDSTTAISSEAIIVKSGGITATQLASNAVEEAKILNGAVTANKLGADCVSGPKIADNSLSAEHYTNTSIHEEHLNDDVISGQAALTEFPAIDDTMLVSDTGTYGNLVKLEFMKYLPLPKCYGNVTYTSSTPAVTGAYNVASVSEVDSKGRRINFTTNMADTNYVVMAGVTGPAYETNFYTTYVVSKATDHFIISNDADESTGRELSFVVFGNYA